jgi:hypothetical protein
LEKTKCGNWWKKIEMQAGSFPCGKEHDSMSEKRRDNKGRILKTGESQRTDER